MSYYPPNHRFAGRFIRLRERLLNVDFRTLVPSATPGPDRWIYIDPANVVSVKTPTADDGPVIVTTSVNSNVYELHINMPIEAVLQALEPLPPATPVTPVKPVKPWDRPPEVRWEYDELKLGGGVVTGYTHGNIRNDRPTPICPKCPGCGTPMTTVRGVVCCPNCGS